MNDDYFFDRDGSPLGGKIPVVAKFYGAGDPALVRPAAVSALNGFLSAVRNSIAESHMSIVQLPHGARMRMVHAFGATHVEVHTVPTGTSSGTDYYGGILAKLHTLPPDHDFLATDFTSPTAGKNLESRWITPPEFKTSGGSPTKSGRPAVPGTRATDQTEWLIFQIARDKPLGPTPIKDGTVKIFRVHNPQYGHIQEVARTSRYVLSTDETRFFMCGKQLTKIPPFPTLPPYSVVRLCTIGFDVPAYAQAALARGIIIFAWDNRLYAYNTGNRAAGWVLLSEPGLAYPFSQMNDFGSTITITRTPGVTTLTCNGSNGAGPCSWFEVTVTQVSGGPPAITGVLHAAHDGTLAAIPAVREVSKTVSLAPDTFTTYDLEYPLLERSVTQADPLIIGIVATPKHLYHYAHGASLSSEVSSYAKEATPERVLDRFKGGTLPYLLPTETTWSWSLAGASSVVDFRVKNPGHPWGSWKGSSGVFIPVEPNSDSTTPSAVFADNLPVWTDESGSWALPEIVPAYDEVFTGDSTYSFHDPYYASVGSPSKEYTLSFSLTGEVADLPGMDPLVLDNTNILSVAGPSTYIFSPLHRFRYAAKDWNTDALRIEEEQDRTATVTGSLDMVLDFNNEDIACLTQGFVTGGVSALGALTAATTITMSDHVWKARLLARDGTVRYFWSDLYALFLGRPAESMAGATTPWGANYEIGYQRRPYFDFITGPAYAAPGPSELVTQSYNSAWPALIYSPTVFIVSSTPVTPTNPVPAQPFSYSFSISDPVSTTMPLSAYRAAYPNNVWDATPGTVGPTNIQYENSAVGSVIFGIASIGRFITEPICYDVFNAQVTFDARRDGFIAGLLLGLRRQGGALAGNKWAAADSLIGNKYGVMPLKTVLQQWFELGESGGTVIGEVFFDSYTGAGALI